MRTRPRLRGLTAVARAIGTILPMWAVWALSASPAPAAVDRAAPLVRVVRVGVDGRALDPLTAELEVEVNAPFDGEIEVLARLARDVPKVEEIPRPLGLRASHRVRLAAGQREHWTLVFPGALHGIAGEPVVLEWQARSRAGVELGRGVAPARLGKERGRDLVDEPSLLVIGVSLPGAVAPASAPRHVMGYMPFDVVVASGVDLARLDAAQRDVLVAAVAQGITLVVTAPAAPLPAGIAPRLESPESVVWQGDRGREIREVPLLFGMVRTTTLERSEALGNLPAGRLVRSVTALSLTSGEYPLGRGFLLWLGESTVDEPWSGSLARAAIVPLGAVAIAGAGALALLFAATRPAARWPPRRAVALVALLVLAPTGALGAWTLWKPFPASVGARTVFHDAGGLSLHVESLSAGEVGRMQGIRFPLDPLGSFVARRWWWEGRLTLRETASGWRELFCEPHGLAGDGGIIFSISQVQREPPPWRVHLSGDGIAGEIVPRRDLVTVLVVHPGGAMSLGAGQAGVSMPFVEDRELGPARLSAADMDLVETVGRALLSDWQRATRSRGWGICVVGRDSQGTVHMEILPGPRPHLPQFDATAPARLEKGEVRAWLPENLAAQMVRALPAASGYGLGLRFVAPGLDASIDKRNLALSAQSVDGFREARGPTRHPAGPAAVDGKLLVFLLEKKR